MRILLFFLFFSLVILIFPSLSFAITERHKLSNGLTVITSINREAPVVAFQVWVKAGSAYEFSHERGITHLIEHMIFKGTPTQSAGEIARTIEALGGEVNAYTTLDHTNYFITIASQNATQALLVLADAVTNASFDERELEAEKEIIIEEIRMNMDDPHRRRQQELMTLSFGDHPYGRPIIGTVESVKNITKQDILNYYSRLYRATNMVVVAVGDFNIDNLLSILEKAFFSLSSQPVPIFNIPLIKSVVGPRFKVMEEKINQAAISISWLVPGLPSPDTYYLDVAAAVLGEGRLSRIYTELKEKLELIDGVDVSNYTPQGLGVFEINVRTSPDKILQAWSKLIYETMKIITDPPSLNEISRTRVVIEAEFIRNRETMQGQARMLGYFEMLYGGFEKSQEYLDRYRLVQGEEVALAVRKYFKPELMSLIVQLPEGVPSPTQEEVSHLVQDIFDKIVISKFEQTQTQTTQKIILSNGMVLVIRPQKLVPMTALVLAAPGGQCTETLGKIGLNQLWAYAVTRGTTTRTYEQITEELEFMGAFLNGFSARSVVGLTGSFLWQDWRRGLKIMSEIWLNPTFSSEQIIRAKAEQAARQRAQEDSPVARAIKLFQKELFSDHSYGQDPLGTSETLASITRDDLVGVSSRLKGSKGVVLSVVGEVDPEEVRREAEYLFSGLQGEVSVSDPGPVVFSTSPISRRVVDFEAKQTQILVGYIAPSAIDSRRYVMALIEAILGGQGGRLFCDLRDQCSLAYAVSPFYNAFLHAGAFGLYMAVSPGKHERAISGLRDHLERLRQFQVSENELTRAKSYLLGREAVNQQSYTAQAMSMAVDEIIGLGYNNYLSFPKLVKSINLLDIQRVAIEVFNSQSEVSFILGPAE